MTNPLLETWPLGAPPFDRIAAEHFLPALREGIARHAAEIAAITANPAAPDFANTLEALERSGELLGRVKRVFWMLSGVRVDAALQAIEEEVSALLSRHATAIGHDAALFARVDAVWRARDRLALDEAQRRLLQASHDGFVRGGANLGPADKARFAAIDERLGALSLAFGRNVLGATDAWQMVLGPDELEGLSATAIAAAARRAEQAGVAGHLFTLDRGVFEDVLTSSSLPGVRERIWRGFTTRCDDGGSHDNNAVIVEILSLRAERAALLGYASHADYALTDSMAKTPDAAHGLMARVWKPAVRQAQVEAAELQALIDAEGGGFALAAWDWRFYAEKVRQRRFDLDGAAVTRYLTLEKVRGAAFDAAHRLYGLVIAPADLPVYHPDAAAWTVTNPQGRQAILYTDYYARPGKHGGAWMGSLRVQERLDGDVPPILYTVANFAKAPDPAETRLSLDEARTLFHEFGHALHALLSNVTYPSQAGTAVARDFVEFPSKLMEHWVLAPEALAGFGMPDTLVAAIGRAERFGQGFATVEFLASAFVDLAIHRVDPAGIDPRKFAADQLAALGTPPEIGMRHRLPYFTHVFDGGYAAAYYSYLWSEVLDADAFEAFEEAGDIFDPATASRLRDEVLARGDARDPLASFVAFRGREPEEAALLRSRGLEAPIAAE
jgi:peptidyl-dipeptidase Dcp